MSIIYEDENVRVVETITENGKTTSFEPKPGSPSFNREAVIQRARQALAANATYLAQPAIPASPTLAQLTAAVRIIRQQVDDLTRQANGLIRIELGLLDDTTDT